MRIAVFDLGTNTFHLLVADKGPGRTIRKVFASRRTVKLGQGAILQHSIDVKPFRRGLKTMREYAGLLKKYRPDKIYAYATSAIRSAVNGRVFVEEVYRQTGIRVEVIDGNREAGLIYLGVRQCVPPGTGYDLIMDIGGGSTEFILAGKRGVVWKHSFDTGVARLLEQFRPSDPLTLQQEKQLLTYLDKAWKPLAAAVKKYPVKRLLGSSGSFESLAEMIGWRFHGRNPLKHALRYDFDLSEYEKLHSDLRTSTSRRRMRMKGLVKMRIDSIVLASLCTRYVLRKFRLKEMVLSTHALKEGALEEA